MRAAWPRAASGVTHTRPAPADPTRRNVHETYTFYNPVHHPAFDREGGREIFIEGTMATTFAVSSAPPMPGYEYNRCTGSTSEIRACSCRSRSIARRTQPARCSARRSATRAVTRTTHSSLRTGPPACCCRVWPAPVDFTPDLRTLWSAAARARAPRSGDDYPSPLSARRIRVRAARHPGDPRGLPGLLRGEGPRA